MGKYLKLNSNKENSVLYSKSKKKLGTHVSQFMFNSWRKISATLLRRSVYYHTLRLIDLSYS